MAPKGLKVGDTFKDYNITYKVLKVVGENYESQAIKIDDLYGEVQEVKEETDFSSVPYAQLKKMCAEKGLDATGSKADLIARLEG